MTSPNVFTNSMVQSESAADPYIDKVEALRHILEIEQRRPVTLSEAREIGEDLLAFYETLATPEPAKLSVESSGVD